MKSPNEASAGTSLPGRVLIVESDPETAMQMVRLCLAEGMEAKLCLGPSYHEDCPGRFGASCPRSDSAEVVFVSVEDNWQRRIVPTCTGKAKAIIACSKELSRSRRELAHIADVMLESPYDPVIATNAIASLVSGREPA